MTALLKRSVTRVQKDEHGVVSTDGDVGFSVAIEVRHNEGPELSAGGRVGDRRLKSAIAIAQQDEQVSRRDCQVELAVSIEVAHRNIDPGGPCRRYRVRNYRLEGAIAVPQKDADAGGCEHRDCQIRFAIAIEIAGGALSNSILC